MFRVNLAALNRRVAANLAPTSALKKLASSTTAGVAFVPYAVCHPPHGRGGGSPFGTMLRRGARHVDCCCAAGSAFAALHGIAAPVRGYSTSALRFSDKKPNTSLAGFSQIQHRDPEQDKKDEQQNTEENPEGAGPGQGYLPFPPPFHTINIISVLFVANIVIYVFMNYLATDDWRDWVVEHFTLSHENYMKIYPFFTCSMYQEQMLQLAIDCWLLWQFGNTMLGFLGPARLFAFWAMTTAGAGLLHIGRQYFELHLGVDSLDVRGRCYGASPFILGLVSVEGLIFRHLNFMQNPPVPFLVLTAFVMIIDVWRLFTIKPEEHGAATGGALVAYFFWLLPTRLMGLDKLTAAL